MTTRPPAVAALLAVVGIALLVVSPSPGRASDRLAELRDLLVTSYSPSGTRTSPELDELGSVLRTSGIAPRLGLPPGSASGLMGTYYLARWCSDHDDHAAAARFFAGLLASLDTSTPAAVTSRFLAEAEAAARAGDSWTALEEALDAATAAAPDEARRRVTDLATRVGLAAWRDTDGRRIGTGWDSDRRAPPVLLVEQRERLARLVRMLRDLATGPVDDDTLDRYLTVLAVTSGEAARRAFVDALARRLRVQPPPASRLLVRAAELAVFGWDLKAVDLARARDWLDQAADLAEDEDALALATYALACRFLRMTVDGTALKADDPGVQRAVETVETAARLRQDPTTAAYGQVVLARALQIQGRFDESGRILDATPPDRLDPSRRWYHRRVNCEQLITRGRLAESIDEAKRCYGEAPPEFRGYARFMVNASVVNATIPMSN